MSKRRSPSATSDLTMSSIAGASFDATQVPLSDFLVNIVGR